MNIGFSLGNLKEDHLEDPDIDGRIILKWILEIGWKVVDWIQVALVNTVITLRFS
jgi:hypothetical protein